MKDILTAEEINKIVEEAIEEYLSLNEQEPFAQPSRPVAPVQQSKVPAPTAKRPPVASTKPTQIAKPSKPTSQTIPGPTDKKEPEVKKSYDPEQAKEKQKMNKTQYQIFNIKMRLGKLGLNDAVRRFAKSIHDFDINVTKNSKDKNDIQSYLSPALGNLIALKGALESMEAEFNELQKLVEEE